MLLPTRLLRRSLKANKSDFGHIFIVAGSLKYSGAALLCAEAAMRSGAGLVTLGVTKDLAVSLIKIKPKEIMLLPLPQQKQGGLSLSAFNQIKDFIDNADVFVIGPGIGCDKATQALARRLIKIADKPAVIDADGLNALAGHLGLLKASRSQGLKATRILTPHPGEMARLLGVRKEEVQAKRKEAAKEFAGDYGVTLVLKGYQTVVADYEGNLYVNKTGNPGMGTAGAGDVLTGIIGAFLGQGLSAFEAAKYGVYLHGLAGDLAAKEKTQISLIASDIIAKIPEAIKRCS